MKVCNTRLIAVASRSELEVTSPARTSQLLGPLTKLLDVRAHNIANMNSSAKAHDIANTKNTAAARRVWGHALSHKETAWTTKTNSGAGDRLSVYG